LLLPDLNAGGDNANAVQQGPIHDLIAEVGRAGEVLNPAQDLMQDIVAVAAKKSDAKPSRDEAWRQADADCRRVAAAPNPIGRILVAMQFESLPILVGCQRESEARRCLAHTALTLLSVRARQGVLPPLLPDDASADPFTGKPLH